MPVNIDSHFLLLLEYVLSHERQSFFDTFAVTSEQTLQQAIANPRVQNVWKSAHLLCRAFEAGFITIK